MSVQGLSVVNNQTVRATDDRFESSTTRRAVQRPAGPVVEAETATEVPNRAQVDRAVESVNNLAQSLKRKLEFSINDSTGHTVIKIVDSESGDVIRQIPPEEMIRLAERLREVQGLIVDSRV